LITGLKQSNQFSPSVYYKYDLELKPCLMLSNHKLFQYRKSFIKHVLKKTVTFLSFSFKFSSKKITIIKWLEDTLDPCPCKLLKLKTLQVEITFYDFLTDHLDQTHYYFNKNKLSSKYHIAYYIVQTKSLSF
jgi:hypothetical protein